MKKLLGIGLIGMLALVCQGASFRPLPMQSQAEWGATHVAVMTVDDLANATTNSCVITNFTPAAKQGVELVGMVLVTPFIDVATNAHNSTLITVGDATGVDLYLTSTGLNTNSTAVYLKYGRHDAAGLTASTVTYTNVIYGGGASTGNVSVTTYTVADTAYGQKLYTAAGEIKTTFTGTLPYPLSALDTGEVRLYFRLKDAAKANP